MTQLNGSTSVIYRGGGLKHLSVEKNGESSRETVRSVVEYAADGQLGPCVGPLATGVEAITDTDIVSWYWIPFS